MAPSDPGRGPVGVAGQRGSAPEGTAWRPYRRRPDDPGREHREGNDDGGLNGSRRSKHVGTVRHTGIPRSFAPLSPDPARGLSGRPAPEHSPETAIVQPPLRGTPPRRASWRRRPQPVAGGSARVVLTA